MSYNSRDIATKLRRYAELLDGEIARARVIDEMLHTDDTSALVSRLEAEIEDARQMYFYLHDLKERI